MARKPVIAGNWKMYKTQSEVVSSVEALREAVGDVSDVEIVVCPTFTSLSAAAEAAKGSSIKVGAQNAHFADEGAFTGEISVGMILDSGCELVILGHSERRQYFQETDELISKKLKKVLETSLTPIVCIGETIEEREAGRVDDVVLGQLGGALGGLTAADVSRIIIAYEPVWAIGTGRTATPEIAEEVHSMIRQWLETNYSEELADGVRILYGGSVKPGNVVDLMAKPNIDGGLVGGASLDPESFAQIVKF